MSHEPDARTTGREISAALSEAWPAVERRLDVRLARRGADKPTREDISQEVAARVLARSVSFTSADDLLPWAVTVADRLLIDYARRAAKAVLVDEVPDREEATPPDHIVGARLEAERVSTAFAELKADDREALSLAIHGLVPGETKRERDAHAVRLHRARGRLRRAIDPIAAFLGAIWIRRVRPATPVITAVATVAVTTALWTSPAPRDGSTTDSLVHRDGGTPHSRVVTATDKIDSTDNPDGITLSGSESGDGSGRRGRTLLPRIDAPIPEGALVSTEVGRTRVEGGTSENTDDKPLICVKQVAPVDLCIDQPVR